MSVLRYTVLNPIRAGICKRPEDYRYSSYNETIRVGDGDGLAESKKVLTFFENNPSRARAAYREFVISGIDGTSIHEQVRAQLFLGDDQFIDKHTIDLPDEKLLEVASAARPDPRPPLEHLISCPMDCDAVYAAYKEWGYNMREIAQRIGKHYSTVSRMIREYETDKPLTSGMQQRKT